MTFTTILTGLDGALRVRLEPLARRTRAVWQQRTSREQVLLRGGAVLLVIVLLWMLALRPALQTLEAAGQQLPVLQAQAARLEAVLLEAQALTRGRSGSIPAGGDTERALQTSLRAAGLETVSALSRLDGAAVGATHWQVQFVNAPAGRIMEWMANLPFVAQMQTHRADLTRSNVNGRDRPGQLSGVVVLVQTPQRNPS